MKRPLRLAGLALLLSSMAPDLAAESLPKYRPALLTRGPRSLVNLINVESLMKRGQKDGIVMFSCFVSVMGTGHSMTVYRASPNSDLLQKEMLGQIIRAEFIPAIYNHNRVPVWLTGTVSYSIANGKPHLRVFLNQEEADLKSGQDFIAPQFAFVAGNPKFKGIRPPPNAVGHAGVAAVTLDVDTRGKVLSSKVAYEHPTGMGFGVAVADPIRDALFVPGFRNGKPVACRFTGTLLFFGRSMQMKSG